MPAFISKLPYLVFQYPFMTLEDLTKTDFVLEYPAGYTIVDFMSQGEDTNIYERLQNMVNKKYRQKLKVLLQY